MVDKILEDILEHDLNEACVLMVAPTVARNLLDDVVGLVSVDVIKSVNTLPAESQLARK